MAGDQVFTSTVFIAGFISFFSPCILPLLPVYISYFGGEGEAKLRKIGPLKINPTIVLRTFLFVLGLATSFVLLGFGAGSFGAVIYSKTFITILGIIVILLGIHQTGLIHVKFLEREKKLQIKRSKRNDLFGTYLLGFAFSFGWTPCIGPVLGAVLGISASEGQGVYGAWLMFIYSLGMMIPFLIISIFSDSLLRHVKKLNKYMPVIRIVGGIVIIIMGILLMTENLNVIMTLFE
ncbi:sulfite exporter TauE/SafE family protein [Vallitalea pronyensis]|uniref:Sulfite exporter TauE/SafE family protein n=1 Tax=Vallitalea pronyensis TaxID=1348613 RepID=A0A8J8SGM8_9FIRM|nr:cytochrome c biogenesis protein CcdA [Vallitalea pronyensis]QUI22483.1 sulfite exporter TauE/SafE family protein [Vallitalea pronyensis]